LRAAIGWNAGALSPEQALRIDCVTVLRLALDDLHARLINGERVDMARMLTASEALAKLLPSAVLAAPPAEHREDPRKALLAMLLEMRDRDGAADTAAEPSLREEIAALRAENEMLRRAARAAGASVTPTEADIVPPSELSDTNFYCGPPKPGPDDHLAPTPRVIEAKAAAAPAADSVDLRAGFDDSAPEPWRSFLGPDGEIRGAGRKYWGPVGG
jgi:hypothetical protein